MIKVNSQKYISLLTIEPNLDMYLSGWDHELQWFLWFFPYIIYTKEINKT